jgi:hypothetical protein
VTIPPGVPSSHVALRRRRPPIARLTLAVALIALGMAVAGDLVGWYRLDLAEGLATVLGVVGLGLVVGAFTGGGRALVLPALLLLPLTMGAAQLGRVHLGGGIGERDYRPTTVSEASDGYHHGVGQVTVDLRDLSWSAGTVRVPVRLGIGEVRVWVPGGVDLDVDTHLGAGQIEVLGRRASGTRLDQRFEIDDPQANRTLQLDVEGGIGHVEVQQRAGGTR